MSAFDSVIAEAHDDIFDVFGDTVSDYTRYDTSDAEPGSTIRVVIDRDVEIQPGGEYQYSARRTEASFLISEVDPRKRDTFTVGGTTYTVIDRVFNDGEICRVVVK